MTSARTCRDVLRPQATGYSTTVKRALLVFLAALAAAACDVTWSEGDAPTALKMIAAVEQYQKDKGTYPESLEALVPRYVPELPAAQRAEQNRPYFYRREDDGFVLSYVIGFNARRVYRSKTRSWEQQD
jgi:hypothetical protein